MSIVIDIILAAIIAVPVILGIKRGLIRSVMGLATVILAVVAANIFMPYTLPFVREKVVEPYLSEPIGEYVETLYEDTVGEALTSSSVVGQMPEALEQLCDTIGIDIAEYAVTNGETDGAQANESPAFVGQITEGVIDKAARVVSFASVFFIAILLLWIVTLILNLIFKLPVLSGINRVTGALFGLICGGAMALVLGNLLIAVMPALVSSNPALFEGVLEKSVILNIIAAL